MTRAEKVKRIHELVDTGMVHREIAAVLGCSRSTVTNLICDPDGAKQLARRERYRGTCLVCGCKTDGSGGFAKRRDYCAAHLTQNPDFGLRALL